MQFKEDAELEVAEEMMKKSQDGNQDNPSDNPF